MTSDNGADEGEAAHMKAEVEALLASVDASERELAGLRDAIASRRDECLRLESDAERLLRRLLVAAEKVGNEELRSVARRELAAAEAEG